METQNFYWFQCSIFRKFSKPSQRKICIPDPKSSGWWWYLVSRSIRSCWTFMTDLKYHRSKQAFLWKVIIFCRRAVASWYIYMHINITFLRFKKWHQPERGHLQSTNNSLAKVWNLFEIAKERFCLLMYRRLIKENDGGAPEKFSTKEELISVYFGQIW